MAKKGTRKVELDGEVIYVPAEEAELCKLIDVGLQMQGAKDVLELELQEVKEQLAVIATAKRAERTSLTLQTPIGQRARIEWHREQRVDPNRAEQLLPKLAGLASMVFVRKVTYGLAKEFQTFMRLPQNAAVEELKTEIAKSIEVHEKKPAVKLIPVEES